MLLQILVSAPSASISSLSEDRLPLFLDACGRILLPGVPKFFVYCHAGPKRETATYKFPNSQEVYWLSLFES